MLIFLLYDYIARSQSQVLAGMVKIASRMIDDVFPKAFKQRVIKEEAKRQKGPAAAAVAGATADVSAPGPRGLSKVTQELRKVAAQSLPFVTKKGKGSAAADVAGGGMDHGMGVLADFYPETTVFFSDIAGFTSWSQSVQVRRPWLPAFLGGGGGSPGCAPRERPPVGQRRAVGMAVQCSLGELVGGAAPTPRFFSISCRGDRAASLSSRPRSPSRCSRCWRPCLPSLTISPSSTGSTRSRQGWAQSLAGTAAYSAARTLLAAAPFRPGGP